MNIQHTVTSVNMVLLAVGAYFGVGLFYDVAGLQMPNPHQIAVRQPAAESSGPPGLESGRPYAAIMDRDLFKTQKTPQPAETAKGVDVENLEATSLKLKLWGTVSGEPDKAYAVIEDTQKREQNLYRVGDSIQDAVIKMILREKVVIAVNGKDEVLAMEKVEQGAARPVAYRGMPYAGTAAPPVAVGAQRISLRRDMINDAMQDVSKLMTDIAITPHLENGQPAGLAMNNIKPNSIFRRMGLRNGDILVGVGGQEIRSVDDALSLYESLKSSDNVTVQLKRRGQERTINYNIR